MGNIEAGSRAWQVVQELTIARFLQGVECIDMKLRRILARMDSAKVIADMDLPGYRLHALKGDLHGFYSVTVRPTGG